MAMSQSFDFYEETAAIRRYRNLPRFGHSDAFASLFEDEKSDRDDYIEGLLFGGLLVLAFFLAWTIALLIFSLCFGKKRFACEGKVSRLLSGRAFQDDILHERRPLSFRLVFLLSAELVIAFSILFVTEGMMQLRTSAQSVERGSSDIIRLVEQATNETNNIQNGVGATLDILPLAQEMFSSSCPTADFLNLAEEALQSQLTLAVVGNATHEKFEQYKSAFADINSFAKDTGQEAQNFKFSDWQCLLVVIPYTLVPVLLMVGTGIIMFDKSIPRFQSWLHWFFLPLFCLMVIAAYVFSSAVLIAASSNADFCSGGESASPSGTIFEVMQIKGLSDGDLSYEMVEHYITKCSATDPFDSIREFRDEASRATSTARELRFSLRLRAADAQLEQDCITDIDEVIKIVELMFFFTGLMEKSADRLLQLLDCQRIVPIYTETVYNGTCSNSITAVTWCFASSLVVAFFGMLMVTFRASLLPTIREPEKHDTSRIQVEEEVVVNAEPSNDEVLGDVEVEFSDERDLVLIPSYYDLP